MSSASGEPCPACGADARYWASKNGYRLVRCRKCHTVLARHENGAEPTGADYTLYHRDADFRAPEAAHGSLEGLVAFADRYRRLGGWLDVGFGGGALLRAAERHRWDCAGVEVSPHALAFGRSRGWRVFNAGEATEGFPAGAFDVVTLVEVIEHLADPVRALSQAFGWLRPGGLLYLTTPNADSFNRRWLGPEWSVFCPPEHLTIWSPHGLRVALLGLGLRIIRLRTHGLNPVEILAAARRAQDRPVHRQQAAEALSHALSQTAARRFVKRTANGALSLLGIGDTIKVWCEKPR